MPPEVLDSVVVHELVHRHHMNHSRAFFDEVISIYPEYKKVGQMAQEKRRSFSGKTLKHFAELNLNETFTAEEIAIYTRTPTGGWQEWRRVGE